MYLQLVDRSIKYLVEILEDVPLTFGHLYILTDFIVMDINKDAHILIFSGIPFLAIVGSVLDFKRGEHTFKVGDENIEFILSKFLKNSSIGDSCCLVDIIDECVKEYSSEPPLVFATLMVIRDSSIFPFIRVTKIKPYSLAHMIHLLTDDCHLGCVIRM